MPENYNFQKILNQCARTGSNMRQDIVPVFKRTKYLSRYNEPEIFPSDLILK